MYEVRLYYTLTYWSNWYLGVLFETCMIQNIFQGLLKYIYGHVLISTMRQHIKAQEGSL